MGCWICHHQVVSIVGEPVGTCSQCWIHACDDHSERPSGSKFQCAIETAKILYASLVFGSPAAVPMGASTAAGRGAQLAFDGWGPGSRMWELSAQHREYWRRRIRRVLERAVADGHSPWFGRELPHDSAALTRLADLVGLVAWYLGLGAQEPYPSVRTAERLMRDSRFGGPCLGNLRLRGPVRQPSGVLATPGGGRERCRILGPAPKPDTRRPARQGFRRSTASAAGNPQNDLVRSRSP
jgi:hypothetical protein